MSVYLVHCSPKMNQLIFPCVKNRFSFFHHETKLISVQFIFYYSGDGMEIQRRQQFRSRWCRQKKRDAMIVVIQETTQQLMKKLEKSSRQLIQLTADLFYEEEKLTVLSAQDFRMRWPRCAFNTKQVCAFKLGSKWIATALYLERNMNFSH